jgi:hypothetical protein
MHMTVGGWEQGMDAVVGNTRASKTFGNVSRSEG